MVAFVPMEPAAFPGYIETLIVNYARDQAEAGLLPPDQASAAARLQVNQLLPTGVSTPDHFLFEIREDPKGERVGWLWYAIRRGGASPTLFIYDIEILPEFQRRGLAAASLRALEGIARTEGCSTIGLNVFGANEGAAALYRKLGYVVQAMAMHKTVPRAGA